MTVRVFSVLRNKSFQFFELSLVCKLRIDCFILKVVHHFITFSQFKLCNFFQFMNDEFKNGPVTKELFPKFVTNTLIISGIYLRR